MPLHCSVQYLSVFADTLYHALQHLLLAHPGPQTRLLVTVLAFVDHIFLALEPVHLSVVLDALTTTLAEYGFKSKSSKCKAWVPLNKAVDRAIQAHIPIVLESLPVLALRRRQSTAHRSQC